MSTKSVRAALRALVLAPALLVPLAASPAVAAPPSTWSDPEPVGALAYLMVLLVIPAALAVLITVLVYVPAMVKGDKYTPGRAWRNENEWFGGPKDGLEAADRVETRPAAEGERGGSSARW